MVSFDNDCYIVVNVGETVEQEILVDFLEFTRDRFAVNAEMIVIVSPQHPHYIYPTDKPYHIIKTPDFRVERGWFATFNKIASIRHLVENYRLGDDTKFFFVDPDMIFVKHFDINTLPIQPGKMIAQHWHTGYGDALCSSCSPLLNCGPKDSAWLYPFGITGVDLFKLAYPLYAIALDVYPDTRDWMTDMYCFLHATTNMDIEVELIDKLAIPNDWGMWDKDVPMIHYTQGVKDSNDNHLWHKRVTHTLQQKVHIPGHAREIDKVVLSLFNLFI